MTPPNRVQLLAKHLDDIVANTRSALLEAARLDDANALGEAARVPDELARAIACLADARNALWREAYAPLVANLEGTAA